MSWKQGEKNKIGKPEQLCWTCLNCVGGCSWSIEFKPVEGWTAVPDIMTRQVGDDIHTYKVYDCPNYERMYNEQKAKRTIKKGI